MSSFSFSAQSLQINLEEILNSLRNHIPSPFETTAALIDQKGELISVVGANSLHFASLGNSVASLRKYISPKVNEIFITNDPYSGNTRLCDLLLIQGAFGKQQANELRFFFALQISLPRLLIKNWQTLPASVEDEGYRIPPSPLDEGAVVNSTLVAYLCQSGISSDELVKILGQAKIGLKKATAAIIAKEVEKGRDGFARSIEDLRKYSEKALKRVLHEIPDGEYVGSDSLDNDGLDTIALKIQCRLSVQGENTLISFYGSSKQTKGPMNCNYAMTLSSCFSVIHSLSPVPIPVNSGAFRAFSVEAPEGTIVNALYPSALLGGYYETSHRIADSFKLALSKASPLLIPSQNGGTSSLVLVKFKDRVFEETLGCGQGASSTQPGADAVKSEFDNCPSQAIEEIEKQFPLEITESRVRETSGGNGKFKGGEGLTRSYRFLEPAACLLMTDRRHFKPMGLYGGAAGLGSETTLISKGQKRKLQKEKLIFQVEKDDILVVSTPGGGGWGKEEPKEIQE